ncbi:PAS fold domain protein, partial [Candidatus Magnetobacterium bavaricum]
MNNEDKTKEQLIEELLHAQDALQQAHAKIERLENIQEIYSQENAINVTIIENITTGVWATDEDDVICYANKGMSKIAGVPVNKIVGRHVLTEFPEEMVS